VRVCFSGFTAQHIGNGTKLGYGPVIDLFAAALRDAGVEVEHRRMTPGEDLTQFDCLIMGQTPVNAMTGTYIYGALDAIARARSCSVGLVFMIDDWAVKLLGSGVRTYAKKPERLVKELFEDRPNWQWANENLAHLEQVLYAMRDRPWPPLLVPKFEWGDPSKLVEPLNSKKFVYVDPSAYATEYPTVIPPDNEKYGAWVLGILSDQRKWTDSLGLGWPVSYIGGKRSKAEKSMKEVDLVQRYAQCWGVLSPPYDHAGSGWWRNRFVYAARTNTILLGDEAEVSPIGDTYRIKASEVEGLTVPQLRDLANAQREQLESWQWPKEKVQQVILDTVREAVEEAKT